MKKIPVHFSVMHSKNVRQVDTFEIDELAPEFVPDGPLKCQFYYVEPGKNAELSLELNKNNIKWPIEHRGQTFILIGKGATLTYVRHAVSSCSHSDNLKLEQDAKVLARFTQNENTEVSFGQDATLAENAILKSGAYWRSGGVGLSITNLKGKNSQTNHIDICSLRNSNKLKLITEINHAAQTKSDVLMKGVVRDVANAILEGSIKIGKNSSKVQSNMEQAMLLLNEGAHAESKPILEIENNDVQCSHAASVREISRERLFYLMSRGIPEEDAKQLILEGFIESAIEKMKKGF